MRKIVFTYYTGFCGSDDYEMLEYPDDISDECLDRDAYQGALNNAETYGIYPLDAYEGTDDPEEDNDSSYDEYSDNIEGSWEEYDPAKHDGMF